MCDAVPSLGHYERETNGNEGHGTFMPRGKSPRGGAVRGVPWCTGSASGGAERWGGA